MSNRVDSLLSAFLLLALAIIVSADRFITETPLSKFLLGVLAGLTIVGGIVYVYRISWQSGQKH
jgi:predicted membrane channel-forming protein YqfA (hemolysin III family)